MPEILLRPALETDAITIRNLIHRVGINPLDLDWKHFVIAEAADKRFMGCAQLKQHRDGSFELASLAVEPGFRGLGVARAIIEHFLANSPRPLYLMCRSALEPLYKKFGFQVIGREAMPPYFRRILKLVRALVFLSKHTAPSVMRLD
jgi:N-acetylglutamate synthase-like GNAT family acetyltransferase